MKTFMSALLLFILTDTSISTADQYSQQPLKDKWGQTEGYLSQSPGWDTQVRDRFGNLRGTVSPDSTRNQFGETLKQYPDPDALLRDRKPTQ